MTMQENLLGAVGSIEQLVGDTALVLNDQNARLGVVTNTFSELADLRMVEGDPTRPGCVRRAIFQGIVYATGGPPGLGSAGDFPRIDLGETSAVYVHFKLPLKITVNNRMFHLRIRGYSYGNAKAVDETIVGYCKASSTRIEAIATKGNFSPTVYVDANNNVVVRLYFPNIYYTTAVIDSMRVSSGAESDMFKRDDIVATMSRTSTVNFG